MPRSKAPTFDEFWNAYGLKRDKVAAQRAWNRLSVTDRRAAVQGIQAYRDDCQSRGISMMYAQGYMNHRRWEDEREESADVSAGAASGTKKEQSPATPAATDTLSDMETW